jgi:lipopolysaccharide export LptBFGC system permease protein LptF
MDELEDLQERNSNHVASMSLFQLNDFVESKKDQIESLQQELALQSVICLQSGDIEKFKSPHWRTEFHDKLWDCNYSIRRAKIEPTRRLAFAFNCFFLTWVCAPLSLHKGEKGALILICLRVMPLLFVFFPASMLLLNVVKNSNMTPLFLWIPNLALFVFGCWLIRKAL